MKNTAWVTLKLFARGRLNGPTSDLICVSRHAAILVTLMCIRLTAGSMRRGVLRIFGLERNLRTFAAAIWRGTYPRFVKAAITVTPTTTHSCKHPSAAFFPYIFHGQQENEPEDNRLRR